MKILFTFILSAFSLAATAETPVFHCVGTEPFWSINVSMSQRLLRYSSPDERFALRILRKRVAQGSSSDGSFILDTRYTSLHVVRGRCSDGMSDRVYTHGAIFDMGGSDVLAGCCDVDSALLD